MAEIIMKHLPLLLFAIGILIEVAAFFIGYADYVPIVYKFISPSFYRANIGLERLSATEILEPQDLGFPEIAQLFKNVAAKQNPPDVVQKTQVTQFVRKGAALAFSTKRAKEVINIEVKLSNDQSVEWDLNEIAPMVDALKTSNTFYWALALFFVGVIIQVIGFLIGTK